MSMHSSASSVRYLALSCVGGGMDTVVVVMFVPVCVGVGMDSILFRKGSNANVIVWKLSWRACILVGCAAKHCF